MEIILLTPGNATEYQELRLTALKSSPEAFSSSYEEEKCNSVSFYEERLNGEQSYTYGAFLHNNLAGTVTLFPETKNKIKHRAHIFAMYVSEEFRKRGLGKALMNAAIEKAQELEGIEQIHLTVNASNEAAKMLYLSLGFSTYGVDKKALNIEGRYYDEELMVKMV
ncbi:GNAT family N-acetyltransferase [Sutcliffiella rhizosphaerae]|uniref:Mycothiol acetyltransferase n=1 Tax=Sutcliffiella rhizosphaerae TaxID=2880967 RepID=A0ABM8YUC1_9BACI|nr:GNAT family N-acetyltransferase [Sutcliffiella rhizosphaerae]CAG9623566.1 Mycothiol acetyltransferase [Sutcliffiella rhizosphaerae]